ncbi:TraB/GumN family protein [Sphingomonas sp.]|uniref:TraB/GumN family protein n=1 Tax=Sphingomonas sp. TaxID=28214 RepID=UPI0017C65AFF|nr:TraB/GumN family protein [Sphingomonas sp.]MBA3511030.1 TraB/GumN family protein [Sphingomonas sp.]
MAKFLIAAALAAASVSPASASAMADADPAIWVVNDHDTIIYLFGTFHALDGRTAWFNDEVLTAFAASDELVLETIVPDLARGAPRSSGASRPPLHPVAATASFLASTRLAISAGRARGMSSANGADMVLREAADAFGKPVIGLESFAAQLNMFRSMPTRPARLARPGEAVGAAPDRVTMQDLSVAMGEMQTAWNRGDSRIFAMMLNQMRWNSPDTYHVMFTQRNAHWAGWIARRLQQPGTAFVAVGVGHLAGPDSVQAKLAELNIRSARIN